jgi:hypothetical protein
MGLFRRTSSDAHWSKDYIEHLRSVHFVLIAVAVTCIAVSRTPDIGRLESAQTQIHQLIDVAARHKPPSQVQFLVVTVASKTYFAELEPEDWFIAKCFGNTKQDEVISADHWEETLASKDNLSDLAEEWDAALCDGHVFFTNISRISKKSSTDDGRDGTVRFVKANKKVLLNKGYLYIEDLDIFIDDRASDWPIGKEGFYVNKDELSFPRLKSGNIIFSNADDADSIHSSLTEIPFYYQTLQFTKELRFAYWRYMHVLVDNWDCNKPFNSCFPDLVVVAKNHTQYSLKDLASYIDGLVSNQSKDFEVVGIKFPKEDLTRWGIILICSILAYFCIHLRELSPKISAKDDGLEVAWLGLYPSWYSQCLLWLSLVGLPALAIISLGKRGAKYEFLWSPEGKTHGSRVLDWLKNQPWKSLLIWIFLPLAICAVLGILSCLSAMKLAKLADTARTAPPSESATDLSSMD